MMSTAVLKGTTALRCQYVAWGPCWSGLWDASWDGLVSSAEGISGSRGQMCCHVYQYCFPWASMTYPLGAAAWAGIILMM